MSNKKEVIKTTNGPSMLESSYAVYGFDRLIVPTDDFFHQQIDAWYSNGPRRDHLARFCDQDRSSPILRGIDIPPVSVAMSPLPLATATATAAPAPDSLLDDVDSVVANLFDDDTVDPDSLPAAAPIEGSVMGDSFKINLVRFTRDPVIVCGPNRRFRLNVRRLRDRVVDQRYLSMHSSPGFPASLQTDAAAIAVATLAHDQPLKPGQLEGLPAQDRAVVARVAARLGMSVTGGSLEQILQDANNETSLVLGSLEAGNNNPEVRAAAYRATASNAAR